MKRLFPLFLSIGLLSFSGVSLADSYSDKIDCSKVQVPGPEKIDEDGVKIERFQHVDGDNVLRGSRPDSDADFDFVIKEHKVKTIISLEQMPWNSGPERDIVQKKYPGVDFESIATRSFRQPVQADMDKIVDMMGDPAHQPVYVHCALGRDRTSLVVAMYKMKYQGYTPEQAWCQMKTFGFSEAFTLRGLHNYFDDHVDPVKVKKALEKKAKEAAKAEKKRLEDEAKAANKAAPSSK